MSSAGQISLSATSGTMIFSKSCFFKMPDVKYIELLVLPGKQMLAVRKAVRGSHYALQWCRDKANEKVPKVIGGMAFLPTLFDLFGWNKNGRYKMVGSVHRKENDCVLLFSTKDAVLYMDEDLLVNDTPEEVSSGENANDDGKRHSRKVRAYPAEWAYSFGDKYYSSCAELEAAEPKEGSWNVTGKGKPYIEADSAVTTHTEAAANIQKILTEMGADYE